MEKENSGFDPKTGRFYQEIEGRMQFDPVMISEKCWILTQSLLIGLEIRSMWLNYLVPSFTSKVC